MKTDIIKKLKQFKIKNPFKGGFFKPVMLLLLGLFLGWLIFGGSGGSSGVNADEHNQKTEENKKQIWTCSMHPQIREDGPGKCPICGMDLIPLDESGGSDSKTVLKMTPSAVSLANIMTQKVKMQMPEKQLHLNGKIEIDERNLHRQIAHFPGRIEKLYVNFTGQKVKKGEKIVRIYSPDLVTAQKELLEAVKMKSIMPDLYKAAVEKLKLWKLSEKQIHDIEKSGNIREEIDVVADAGGYVIKRNITEGSQVRLGDVLFEIADLSKVWVVFDVYEEDTRWVKVGDMIDFTVSSLPSEKFKARVKYVVPVLNSTDRTVKVWTEYANMNDMLKPGMFVRGELKSRIRGMKNALVIPKSAVLWTGKRSIVWVKLPDTETPQFSMREITLGANLGDAYIVADGLSEGEEIVVNGVFNVDAAAQLSGKYSSMNQPSTKVIKEEEKESGTPYFIKDTPEEFKRQLRNLIHAYLELTDALVQSDSKKAVEKAVSVLNKLKKVDMSLLSHQGHNYWMKKMKIIKENLKAISGEKNLEKQRKAFVALSDALISSAKAFGTGEQFYVVHCPMANDGKGAEWLSIKKQVLNPYYGEIMLNCGDVVGEVK